MKLYWVKSDYVEKLHQIDRKVFYHPHIGGKRSHASELGEIRPYVGVIITVGECPFFVPLSSYSPRKKWMERLKNSDPRYVKIVHQVGKKGTLGLVRICNMIPVMRGVYSEVSLQETKDKNKKYAALLANQLRFLARHSAQLHEKAKKIVKISRNEQHFYHSSCCNFDKLRSFATSLT